MSSSLNTQNTHWRARKALGVFTAADASALRGLLGGPCLFTARPRASGSRHTRATPNTLRGDEGGLWSSSNRSIFLSAVCQEQALALLSSTKAGRMSDRKTHFEECDDGPSRKKKKQSLLLHDVLFRGKPAGNEAEETLRAEHEKKEREIGRQAANRQGQPPWRAPIHLRRVRFLFMQSEKMMQEILSAWREQDELEQEEREAHEVGAERKLTAKSENDGEPSQSSIEPLLDLSPQVDEEATHAVEAERTTEDTDDDDEYVPLVGTYSPAPAAQHNVPEPASDSDSDAAGSSISSLFYARCPHTSDEDSDPAELRSYP